MNYVFIVGLIAVVAISWGLIQLAIRPLEKTIKEYGYILDNHADVIRAMRGKTPPKT